MPGGRHSANRAFAVCQIWTLGKAVPCPPVIDSCRWQFEKRFTECLDLTLDKGGCCRVSDLRHSANRLGPTTLTLPRCPPPTHGQALARLSPATAAAYALCRRRLRPLPPPHTPVATLLPRTRRPPHRALGLWAAPPSSSHRRCYPLPSTSPSSSPPLVLLPAPPREATAVVLLPSTPTDVAILSRRCHRPPPRPSS